MKATGSKQRTQRGLGSLLPQSDSLSLRHCQLILAKVSNSFAEILPHIHDIVKVEIVFKDGVGCDPAKLRDSERRIVGIRQRSTCSPSAVGSDKPIRALAPPAYMTFWARSW